jgi:hypothetical protein
LWFSREHRRGAYGQVSFVWFACTQPVIMAGFSVPQLYGIELPDI